jgi:hypothetical protein
MYIYIVIIMYIIPQERPVVVASNYGVNVKQKLLPSRTEVVLLG